MDYLNTKHYDLFSTFNQGWRIIATGLCFALFGLGGLLMSTCWFSLLRVTIKNDIARNRITQNSIRYSFRFFLKTVTLLRILEYRFHHIERLEDDGGCLIIANHPSLLDYVLLAAHMPRCDCIVKQSLLNNFFVRGVIKSAGYIANSDSDILLPLCEEKLRQGGMILIFPEGTRSTPGQKPHLQRGAANIALRCGANIRIVTINCDQPMLTKEEKWYNIPRLKPIFTITVQNKIGIEDFISDETESLAIAARHLTKRLSVLLLSPSEKPN